MRAVGFAIWAGLAALGLVLELAGHRHWGALAPVEDVLRVLRDTRVGRPALVVAWMWLGWHLFAR